MKVVDKYTDNGAKIYTVKLEDDVFVDVKLTDSACFVMQCADGFPAYNLDGNTFDYSFNENEVVNFVNHYKHLPTLINCKDYEILKKHLTAVSLNMIDEILKAAADGRIGLQAPRDTDGNWDYSDGYLKVEDTTYRITGFENLVLRWYEGWESTERLINRFKEIQNWKLSSALDDKIAEAKEVGRDSEKGEPTIDMEKNKDAINTDKGR